MMQWYIFNPPTFFVCTEGISTTCIKILGQYFIFALSFNHVFTVQNFKLRAAHNDIVPSDQFVNLFIMEVCSPLYFNFAGFFHLV